MEAYLLKEDTKQNVNQLLAFLKNSNWAFTANEKDIDNLFKCALKLEEISLQDNLEKDLLLQYYPAINFNKSVELLIENIIKNNFLNEHLTLYVIKKYTLLYSKEKFSDLLEKILTEVELRRHLFKLTENFSDPDVDFFVLNNFLSEICCFDVKSKLQSALKSQTSLLLKAIKYGDYFTGQRLIDEMLVCLESQTDLRFWFMIMKEENLVTVLDLCAIYNNFLVAIFKFFDNFANEIESIYDEELNVQYSHVNLDFEDFVKVFQAFLNEPNTRKETLKYLESKSVTDKNFCFWIDVKTCL